MVEGAKLIGARISYNSFSRRISEERGLVFSALINGTSRNPNMKNELFSMSILAFSLCEAIALFALMVAFLILFAF